MIKIIAHEQSKKRSFFGFLSSSPVDFSEVTVSNENIIIDVKHKMLNPWRGTGEIHMTLYTGGSNTETKIKGEIIPYKTLYLFTFYMVVGFLVLWTFLVFAMTSGKQAVIMAVFAWAIFPLVLYLILLWNRSMLREYKDSFLATLKQSNIETKNIR